MRRLLALGAALAAVIPRSLRPRRSPPPGTGPSWSGGTRYTVTKTGRIQGRFGGRVILIDVGMSPAYLGRLAALEIAADGTMTALYPDTRQAIGPPVEPPSVAGEAAVAARP